jgi:50S ribosomal subunit-associated GTPase HflX
MVFSCCKFLIMDHKHHCVVSSFQQYMFNNNSVNLTIMIIKGSIWRGICHGVQYGLSRSRQILRSEVEIEKMHERRKKEDRGWETVKEREIGFKVSLVGLPNSGKSSLFNCLVGERLALVDHHPSMTRDRRQFTIMDGLVTLIDTPGV